jgi:hypothetical protein
MYRDDYAATHARLEQIQRELADARSQGQSDQQRIAMLSSQLAATQQALARFAPHQIPGYSFPPRNTTVLVLGILSLVLCSLMGPFAWSMGNEELRRIDGGLTSPVGRGSAEAGRICGIISTALMVLGIVFGLMFASMTMH